MYILCLVIFLFFVSLLYILTSSLDNSYIKYYEEVSHQIIRQAIKTHGSFCVSGIPWVTPYTLQNTDTYTRVSNKQTIYLVIRKPNGTFYDNHTIIKTLIHELAHLYHENDAHDKMFKEIEQQLLKSAKIIGYYDPLKEIDKTYPCKH